MIQRAEVVEKWIGADLLPLLQATELANQMVDITLDACTADKRSGGVNRDAHDLRTRISLRLRRASPDDRALPASQSAPPVAAQHTRSINPSRASAGETRRHR